MDIADIGVKMCVKLEKNMTDYGIHSRWTFKSIPEIEQIVNEMTYLRHCENQSTRIFEHSLSIETVGLPLPFQQNFEEINQVDFVLLDEDMQYQKIDQDYYSPSLVFVEKHDKNVSSIHYNALKMRIPGIDSVSATTDFEPTSDSHSNYQSLFNEKISMSSEERKLTHLFDDESFIDKEVDDDDDSQSLMFLNEDKTRNSSSNNNNNNNDNNSSVADD